MSWITSRLGQHGPESIPAAVLGDDAILIVHQASQKDIQQIMELGFSAEEAKNALAISVELSYFNSHLFIEQQCRQSNRTFAWITRSY